jgi:hypothetical protein
MTNHDRSKLRLEPVTHGPAAKARPAASAEASLGRRAAAGAVRGCVAAMAMTGMREVTRRVGLLGQPPPEAITRQSLRFAPLRRVASGPRRVRVELIHWAVGAAGGAAFAALPVRLRRRGWAAPLFGVAIWSVYQGIAPLLGIPRARRGGGRERLALLADHTLYGLVLTERRRIP